MGEVISEQAPRKVLLDLAWLPGLWPRPRVHSSQGCLLACPLCRPRVQKKQLSLRYLPGGAGLGSLASGAHDSQSKVRRRLGLRTRRPADLQFPGARSCLLFHWLRLSPCSLSFSLCLPLCLLPLPALDSLSLYCIYKE
uniref:Uncharacterized protein n=1 Tax=Molossus molossus TaxID=27622 RepID=A0A7J8IZ56_MOLMO|nr:hypothetical protein HJG59_010320 [Molossus molossus]